MISPICGRYRNVQRRGGEGHEMPTRALAQLHTHGYTYARIAFRKVEVMRRRVAGGVNTGKRGNSCPLQDCTAVLRTLYLEFKS